MIEKQRRELPRLRGSAVGVRRVYEPRVEAEAVGGLDVHVLQRCNARVDEFSAEAMSMRITSRGLFVNLGNS